MGILNEKVPAPTIKQQNTLPDNGGSLLPQNPLKNTAPYRYKVDMACLETPSEADFTCLKERTSVAVGNTHNDIPQEAVFDALARSENKEFKIKRASTQIELKELLSDLERVRSDHRVWVVYNVKNNDDLRFAIKAGNKCLQLVPQVFDQAFVNEEEKIDTDAGVLMDAEELRMILGPEIGQNLIKRAEESNGVIKLKGVILKEPREMPKLIETTVNPLQNTVNLADFPVPEVEQDGIVKGIDYSKIMEMPCVYEDKTKINN